MKKLIAYSKNTNQLDNLLGRGFLVNLEQSYKSTEKIIFLRLLAVVHFNGELSAFKVDDRGFVEINAEVVNIHCRRHDNNL